MRQMHVIPVMSAMTWHELAVLAISVPYAQAWVQGNHWRSGEGHHVMTPTVSMRC